MPNKSKLVIRSFEKDTFSGILLLLTNMQKKTPAGNAVQ